MKLIERIQRLWDAGASFIGRYPRTYAFIAFLLFVFPPNEIAKLIWNNRFTITATFQTIRVPGLSWWNAIGALLFGVVLFETRRANRLNAGRLHALELADSIQRDTTVKEIRLFPAAVEELGRVQEDLKRVREERDSAQRALASCKQSSAHAQLRWFATLLRTRIEHRRERVPTQEHVHVTIRFAAYDDWALVQQIGEIIKTHTQWPVEVDGSNNPTIRPDDKYKVIFESGLTGTFNEVAAAFVAGELLPCTVGWRATDRAELEHLVIEVTPSVAAKLGTGSH